MGIPRNSFEIHKNSGLKPPAWYQISELQKIFQIHAKEKLPVMLWIHGGSLRDGSARQWGIGGVVRNLVTRGVVVVIIQYRLGTLGFFTTMNDEFPPNLGMLDQVEAIKFVVAHIHHFGGDPKRLTLFGQSAGAASVSAHTYSPLSQHLFQNAILESGTIMTCLNGVFGKSKNSQHIAKIVCNITDWPPSALKTCLQTDLLGWKMSVDGYFLPGTPEQLHSKRPNIPIILGTCKDEWSFWGEFNTISLRSSQISGKKSTYSALIRRRKLPLIGLNETELPELIHTSNRITITSQPQATGSITGFTSFIATEANWYLENNNSNVYMYEFEYVSAVGRIFKVPGWNRELLTYLLTYLLD
ncbi:unnamed protein product [Anisakis simplex]|uniref:Carboxylic ester hydrolase n=1 Tax=Anisakis simplex TaxID=6269 RepID=A0A0M3J3K1_ANISI|nr:unnamed protein product [Anisakis simplex]